MTYEYLSTRREGAVEYLTLNRPDVRNAFNAGFVAELTRWAASAREASEHRGLRAVVLGGAGRVFCAGADLAWMAETVQYTEDENRRDAMALAEMFLTLDTLPVPLVGRIHGAALGGGCGLVSVCDIAIAERECTFGFTEVKLGILPAAIAPFALAKIGRSAARELFLTGARFSAARAREMNLVHAVVPAEELDSTVTRYTNQVLSAAPGAVATAKALIPDLWGRTLDDALPFAASVIARRRVTPEAQEGMRAFLEKRKPKWSEGQG
jgi:methylglutaconyl-CoA hydratase